MALSELFLSLLVRGLRARGLDAFSFVDDVHAFSDKPEVLKRGLDFIRKFSWDFCLDLSAQKSCIWGSQEKECRDIAAAFDFSYSDSICTMGAEWVLRPGRNPSELYVKEISRLRNAKARLERMMHVKAKLHIKASAIQIAIMSLMAYLPHPLLTTYNGMRTSIKRALGQLFGSWEIYAWVLCSSSIDAEVGWVVSLLHLWKTTCDIPGGREVLKKVKKKNAHSRFTSILLWCRRHEWHLQSDSLAAGDFLVPFSLPWKVCRADILKAMRIRAFEDLELRRPLVYGGLAAGDISIKAHRDLAAELSSYDLSILHRIWCGVPLTLSHRHTLDHSVNPQCPCGLGVQTMTHLLWSCPLSEPPDLLEQIWKEAPAFVSAACLCPGEVSPDKKTAWRMLCLRAIRILGRETHQPRLPELDLKNHSICFEKSGRYAFCTKCFVARRITDYRWICLRVCKRAGAGGISEGDYFIEGEHVGRLELAVWRGSAIRPYKKCVRCDAGTWAKSPLSGCCIRQD